MNNQEHDRGEISYLSFIVVNHYVVRLYVAVHDAFTVTEIECLVGDQPLWYLGTEAMLY